MRPFRFGVVVFGADNRADWQEKARRVEQLGYSTFLVPDHVAQSLPPAEMFPPLVSLMSAADATNALRVGTFVMNNDFYNPVLLARDAAACDLLTDGRFELGLGAGAGNMGSEYREMGRTFDSGRIRVQRLTEGVTIIKGLLAGEEVTFLGNHYAVSGHRLYPLPSQKPRPPILIGGSRPGILALAAREADIVGFVGANRLPETLELDFSAFTAAGTERRVAAVREAAASGLDRLEFNLIVSHVNITNSPRAAVQSLARDIPLSESDLLSSPYVLIGSIESVVEALQQRREQYGFSYWVVAERYMTALAPVVGRLAGA